MQLAPATGDQSQESELTRRIAWCSLFSVVRTAFTELPMPQADGQELLHTSCPFCIFRRSLGWTRLNVGTVRLEPVLE